MSDLVERLRDLKATPADMEFLVEEAADEIERLTALVDSCSARNEADVDRIAKLEAVIERKCKVIDIAYDKDRKQVERIAQLEAEKLELADGNIKRWEDSCAMANRIAKLEAELKLYRPSGDLLMNTLTALQEKSDA